MNKLMEFGASALKPMMKDGKWVKPLLSARKAANLRKKAIKEGTYGAFCTETGKGWDPLWDSVKKVPALRPHKLHKYQRNRKQRFEKIEKAMEDMPKKIEKYRQGIEDAKPVPGIETTFKRLAQQR
mmetsp:Transcript_1357/g.1830  ORF Transcript_1357/g.1830 Transcript_1357/m.1830 type:complete len:126 (-) Transcript_1357:331-708(-)|eukprot:CAMPEP_0117756580 /NCGR_PEP_ID=MMETSP0947-20121206/14167_1 /TAXON_ID=44440 /ORGANISM="Chattonella subsalsa, Strain CCMP2191" /LENGTH=125 /DNA_ID=CAMNT_0005576203 /DNA_START=86 /DNA_END=463 /DNA_ORIENTATION=+